jgi:hypothetical protein
VIQKLFSAFSDLTTLINNKKVDWLVSPYLTETHPTTIPTKDELTVIFDKAYAVYSQKDCPSLSRAEVKNLFRQKFAGFNMPNITESQIEDLVDSIDQKKIETPQKKLVEKDSGSTFSDSAPICKVLNHHALI